MAVLTDLAVARAALTAFSPPDAVTAVAIALAESGGDPAAHNDRPPDDSWGLWQINMLGNLGTARRAALGLAHNSELADPVVNARAAAYVNRAQGWRAWSVFLHGTYAQFLARAQVAVADARALVLHRVLRVQDPLLRGADVRNVQRLVGAHVDALYGPETAERVRRWQTLHHLSEDGVFGPASCQAAGWTWAPAGLTE